jgi:F0F1-type ATP synthase delta subunit
MAESTPETKLRERAKIVLDKIEEVRKSLDEISNILKDEKLNELIEKLNEYAKTLQHYVDKNAAAFSIGIYYITDDSISVTVSREHYAYVIRKLPKNVQLIEIYRMFFDDNNALNELISHVVYALANVALEVGEKANVFRKLREIEATLRALESEVAGNSDDE